MNTAILTSKKWNLYHGRLEIRKLKVYLREEKYGRHCGIQKMQIARIMQVLLPILENIFELKEFVAQIIRTKMMR